MNFTSEQVELIVQRVLKHLAPPAEAAPAATNAPAVSRPAPPRMQISEPVITQALLACAINGSKQVCIGTKAILTPSAWDYIRHQQIEIIRADSSGKVTATARWQVIVTRAVPQIALALESLKQLGISCEQHLVGLTTEGVSQAISAVCRGEATKVVVFTDQPELFVCLVNRNERLRAAAVAEVATVERVEKSLKANLLAIDPAGKNVFELRNLLKAFATVP